MAKFEKSPPSFVALFDDLVARLPADRRVMFGCPVAFAHDRMFAGLLGRRVFVRLDEAGFDELFRLEGAAPFDPMGRGRASRTYGLLPEAMLDDEDAVLGWLRRAMELVSELPPKSTKVAKKPARKRR